MARVREKVLEGGMKDKEFVETIELSRQTWEMEGQAQELIFKLLDNYGYVAQDIYSPIEAQFTVYKNTVQENGKEMTIELILDTRPGGRPGLILLVNNKRIQDILYKRGYKVAEPLLEEIYKAFSTFKNWMKDKEYVKALQGRQEVLKTWIGKYAELL